MKRLIENEMEKQERPTLEEVKEYFKDAKEIKDGYTGVIENVCVKEIEFDVYSYWIGMVKVWDKRRGYSEIISYKKPQIEEIIDIIKPKQYDIGIDTFQRAEANMTLEEVKACVTWNIDKYNWRKKGQDREDLVKIIDYCKFAIKQIDNDTNSGSRTL